MNLTQFHDTGFITVPSNAISFELKISDRNQMLMNVPLNVKSTMRLGDHMDATLGRVSENLRHGHLGPRVKMNFRLLKIDELPRPRGQQRHEDREALR